MGRGLDQLFGEISADGPLEQASSGDAPEVKDGRLLVVELAQISPNPDQPRRHFDAEALEELAGSIKAQGLLQPILVREQGPGQYQIIAGERRWRACQLAGLTEVPVIARLLDDAQSMAAALIENLQRENLNPLEEAQGLEALRIALALNQEQLAERVGKSRPAVANALRLLHLSEAAKEDLGAGRLSAGQARALLAVEDAERAEELRKQIIAIGLTVREAEAAAQSQREQGRFPWEAEALAASATGASDATTADAALVDAASPSQEGKTQIALLGEIQALLAECLDCPAKVSGTAQRGKISLRYQSAQQLADILKRLGLAMPGDKDA